MRLTFTKGARLEDPKRLFNTRLESNSVRAIDVCEGDTVDRAGLKALILEAARLNMSKAEPVGPARHSADPVERGAEVRAITRRDDAVLTLVQPPAYPLDRKWTRWSVRGSPAGCAGPGEAAGRRSGGYRRLLSSP